MQKTDRLLSFPALVGLLLSELLKVFRQAVGATVVVEVMHLPEGMAAQDALNKQ